MIGNDEPNQLMGNHQSSSSGFPQSVLSNAFHQRARLNSAARYGKYTDAMEKELVGAGA